MEYILYFLFFLLGVTFVKAFGFIVNVGYSIRILKACEVAVLHMLISVTEDVAFAREIKYHAARETGMGPKALQTIKLIDDETTKNWKETVVKKLIHCYPHSYRDYLEYDDWSGAMRYLDKVRKNK